MGVRQPAAVAPVRAAWESARNLTAPTGSLEACKGRTAPPRRELLQRSGVASKLPTDRWCAAPDRRVAGRMGRNPRVRRDEWAHAMHGLANDIDYGNFKSAVAQTPGW